MVEIHVGNVVLGNVYEYDVEVTHGKWGACQTCIHGMMKSSVVVMGLMTIKHPEHQIQIHFGS